MIDSIQKYRNIFSDSDAQIQYLGKSLNDVKRLANLLIDIDSEFLFSTENEEKLIDYAKKLIDNGNNFILTNGTCDIGVLSIYTNDFLTKTAFTSTIGIIPSFRGGRIIVNLVEFAIEFARESGMEKYRAEIHIENAKWLKFLINYKFQIESETENGTFMIVRDL